MSSQPTFSTERLQLAVFLHATSRLSFTGCQPNGNGNLRFQFDDPERMGHKLNWSLIEVRPW